MKDFRYEFNNHHIGTVTSTSTFDSLSCKTDDVPIESSVIANRQLKKIKTNSKFSYEF